jgi:hypothetical protein
LPQWIPIEQLVPCLSRGYAEEDEDDDEEEEVGKTSRLGTSEFVDADNAAWAAAAACNNSAAALCPP